MDRDYNASKNIMLKHLGLFKKKHLMFNIIEKDSSR